MWDLVSEDCRINRLSGWGIRAGGAGDCAVKKVCRPGTAKTDRKGEGSRKTWSGWLGGRTVVKPKNLKTRVQTREGCDVVIVRVSRGRQGRGSEKVGGDKEGWGGVLWNGGQCGKWCARWGSGGSRYEGKRRWLRGVVVREGEGGGRRERKWGEGRVQERSKKKMAGGGCFTFPVGAFPMDKRGE